MTEPVTPGDSKLESSAAPEAATEAGVALRPADQIVFENARAACRSLEQLGYRAGWALAALGLLAGSISMLERAVQDGSRAGWATVLLRAGLWTAGCGLGGWALAVLSRAAAAVSIAALDRANQNTEKLSSQAAQTVALLERITRVVEERRAVGAENPRDIEKAAVRVEIERATRSAAWEEAEALLNRFEADHPDDPTHPALRAALSAARQRAVEERLAELEAARDVNDPGRVLEVYENVAPLLEAEARAKLHGGLAPWFLGLIHRRLRHGKIQPDVVKLAERFSVAFSTTVEGASVRASLSTLRRSVGLCPRCARPYVGLAEACPRCLGGGPNEPEASAPHPEPAPPG